MTEPRARPRILLVTRNLPPLVGGMERLNWHIADELAKFADIRVVGPAGSGGLAPAGIEVIEAPLNPLWRFLWKARGLALRVARAWRPNVLLAGSGLMAPIAVAAAGACGATSCIYVHGLDVAVSHPVYRAIWLPAIRKAHRIIANSRPTADLCRQIGICDDKLGIVHPGVDSLVLAAGDASAVLARRFRTRHGLGDRPLLLSVGRLSTRKGLREFVASALPEIVRRHPEVMLLIVGAAPNNALHAQAQTPESVREAAKAAGVAAHLLFLGAVSDSELDAIYRAADVHVFPVRKLSGDPEGFGMVAIEAAARGLPTVAFANGGVIDAVAEGRSGHLIEPEDYQAFAAAVARVIETREELRQECIAFSRQFAWPEFGLKMARLLGIDASVSEIDPASGNES